MELNNFNNKELMSIAASRYTKDLIDKKIRKDNEFTLALSGGGSPVRYYELLAEENIDWARVKIFFVDERNVPANHVHSNFRMINQALISKINIPESNIFPLNTENQSVTDCSLEYEKNIKKAFGNNLPRFNLIVLGAGPDGHTASIFPDADPYIEENRIFIPATAPSQFDVRERLTMTLALINMAHNRIFIISGTGKKSIVQGILDQNPLIPAGLVNPDTTVFTDSY